MPLGEVSHQLAEAEADHRLKLSARVQAQSAWKCALHIFRERSASLASSLQSMFARRRFLKFLTCMAVQSAGRCLQLFGPRECRGTQRALPGLGFFAVQERRNLAEERMPDKQSQRSQS